MNRSFRPCPARGDSGRLTPPSAAARGARPHRSRPQRTADRPGAKATITVRPVTALDPDQRAAAAAGAAALDAVAEQLERAAAAGVQNATELRRAAADCIRHAAELRQLAAAALDEHAQKGLRERSTARAPSVEWQPRLPGTAAAADAAR